MNWACVIGIGAKKWKFHSYLKDLKWSTYSDMWAINKTHNKFLGHELKLRFKLLNFVRKLFLILLKKTTPCMIWKIYLYEIFLFIWLKE